MRQRVGWIAMGLCCGMLVSGCAWYRDALAERRAARVLAARVEQELASHGALAADRALGAHPTIQGSLASGLERRIARRAAGQCGARSTRYDTPYLRAVVRRYCAHFGAPLPADLPRPHGASGVDVTARVEGVGSPAATELIERALRSSSWYDPAGASVTAELGGDVALAYRPKAPGDLHVGELLPPGEPEFELYTTTETFEETKV